MHINRILWIFLNMFTTTFCSQFICNNSLEKGVCSRKDKNSLKNNHIFQINPCKEETEECDLHFGEQEDYCILKSSNSTLYPGEYCTNNYECISGMCEVGISHKCLASHKDGDLCKHNNQCPVTSFCALDPWIASLSYCFKLLDENDQKYTCDINPAGFKCRTNLVCNGGTCVKPGSIKIGNISQSPEACETHYMFKPQEEKNFICTKGPILVDSKYNKIKTNKPYPCQQNELCYYAIQFKGKKIKLPPKRCTISFSNSPKGYCHPGLGNMELEIKKLFAYLERYNGSCHAANPFFCNFYKQTDPNFFDAYVAQARIREYINVYDNSECVKSVINYQYYYALNRSTFSFSAGILLAFPFLMIFLILII